MSFHSCSLLKGLGIPAQQASRVFFSSLLAHLSSHHGTVIMGNQPPGKKINYAINVEAAAHQRSFAIGGPLPRLVDTVVRPFHISIPK